MRSLVILCNFVIFMISAVFTGNDDSGHGVEAEVSFLPKQMMAYDYWLDDVTEEIVYGGSKGAGKTHLGCGLIFMNAITYPGTHYFIARKSLSDLREHTRPSIAKWFRDSGLDIDDYCTYNGQDNYYTLTNGSRVSLIHAEEKPSDPLFERFGSMQHTQGWIEEAGEFDTKAYLNLRISCGRWRNKEYGLMGKLLLTCNPKKNFLYDEFYLPHKEDRLPPDRKFIQTYPWENPFLTVDYLKNLKKLKKEDPVAYERLYLGNWDYADDETSLFEYQDTMNMFSPKSYLSKNIHKRFLTIDPSGKGKDRTVIMVWAGMDYVERVYSFSQIKADDLEKTIKAICTAYEIPFSRIIYDDDGLGWYLGDYLPGSYPFKGGAQPLGNKAKKEYQNLRTQLYYLLAKDVKAGQLFINCQSKEYRKQIIRDLSAIRADKVDDDGKKFLEKKKETRKILGISPDWADNLMMSRMAMVLIGK